MDIILAATTCAFLTSLVSLDNPYLKAGLTWAVSGLVLVGLNGGFPSEVSISGITGLFVGACTAAFVANVLLLIVSRLVTLKYAELTRRRY